MIEDLPGHIIAIVILLLLKGLAMALTVAYSVLRLKRSHYISEGSKLEGLMENAQSSINACSVANAFMGVIIGFLSSLSPYEAMRNAFGYIENQTLRSWVSAAVVIVVVSFFFALVGIIIPRLVASRHPDAVVLRLSAVADLFGVLFKPISLLTDLVYMLVKQKLVPDEDVSEEEILMMVDAGSEQGSIDEHEMEMITNVFEFDDKLAGEIATHRKDITALSVDASAEQIAEVIQNEKYSRLPVYEEDIDHIVGILHVKDFMHLVLTEGIESFDMKKLMMEPYFVPYTKKTDELFAEMQRRKIHMAIVSDEYGGTEGVVTMEDLIEEIMGEINDEYDEEEQPDIDKLSENVVSIEGATALEDVAQELNIPMPEEEYDTLGGFLIAKLDRIPDESESGLTVEYEGYIFEIEKIEDNRIVRVNARKQDDVSDGDEERECEKTQSQEVNNQ